MKKTVKMNQTNKRKIDLLVKCQCKERAVKRPESLLTVITCRKCGKVFRSNRNSDLCFKCEKKD